MDVAAVALILVLIFGLFIWAGRGKFRRWRAPALVAPEAAIPFDADNATLREFRLEIGGPVDPVVDRLKHYLKWDGKRFSDSRLAVVRQWLVVDRANPSLSITALIGARRAASERRWADMDLLVDEIVRVREGRPEEPDPVLPPLEEDGSLTEVLWGIPQSFVEEVTAMYRAEGAADIEAAPMTEGDLWAVKATVANRRKPSADGRA